MKKLTQLSVLLFWLCNPVLLPATTIIPFPNLGEMAKASGAVVLARADAQYINLQGSVERLRTQFTVQQSIQGPLGSGATFELQSITYQDGDEYFVADGDPKYETGATYLLFLAQRSAAPYWQPILMDYAIFKQFTVNSEALLVPTLGSDFMFVLQRPDGVAVEPLGVYKARSLARQLSAVCSGQEAWNRQIALAPYSPFDFSAEDRTAPSHCTFLQDGNGQRFRWTGFPGTSLPVYAEDDGDNGYMPPSTAFTIVTNAVAAQSVNYTGTNVDYAGTVNFTPNCSDGTFTGSDFNAAIAGTRWAMVVFNDPCSEIADLSSCAGTLAFGGMSGSGTHVFDGLTHWSARYGRVLVNNGVTCLSQANYEIMLTHELTHVLGIGHISGSGTANMNPFCCVNITALDILCLDYYYPPAAPVELVDFQAEEQNGSVLLYWETASEYNNDYFEIQHSLDGSHFYTIGKQAGMGNSQVRQQYVFEHSQPARGTNYYRLRQVDFDGDFEFSDMESVKLAQGEEGFVLRPNPARENVELIFYESREERHLLRLYDAQGGKIREESWPAGQVQGKFDLRDLPAGLYWLEVPGAQSGATWWKKIIKE